LSDPAIRITLTFDNGPEPGATPGVLDCLARHGIKTTFFVMGRKVTLPEARKCAERAAAEGHWIGNHTFEHKQPLGQMTAEDALSDFDRGEAALSWLKQTPRLFRPYGRQGRLGPHLMQPAIVDRLRTLNASCVLWNSVPGDWRDPHGWLVRAIADIPARPWSLVVLHDLPNGSMSYLDEYLTRAKDLGVEFHQDFPPECVPIRNGVPVLPLENCVGPEHQPVAV
jgi:peptidoglycan/xylan/chitin deacetylase (PgdA/CDA1 family)